MLLFIPYFLHYENLVIFFYAEYLFSMYIFNYILLTYILGLTKYIQKTNILGTYRLLSLNISLMLIINIFPQIAIVHAGYI